MKIFSMMFLLTFALGVSAQGVRLSSFPQITDVVPDSIFVVIDGQDAGGHKNRTITWANLKDDVRGIAGISDGDKGDITLSGGAGIWTIDTGVIDYSDLIGSPGHTVDTDTIDHSLFTNVLSNQHHTPTVDTDTQLSDAQVATAATNEGFVTGAHTSALANITDVTATAAEVNSLDLSALTAGDVYSADTATTASWKPQAAGGSESTAVVDTAEVDLTLTGFDITADLITGSVDVLKLDAGVQTSLGLADTAIQSPTNGTDLTLSVGDDITTDTLGTGNFRAGDGAGASIIAGGDYNTATGTSSLAANTTGDYNTASGYVSLASNTTGDYNTGLGAFSLNFSTTASNNTAIGHGSLYSSTTGYNNTAVGMAALYLNTTGEYNAAHGANSLRTSTTGSYNAAHGAESMYANTSGSNNAAMGFEALRYNTSGYYNVAIGNTSMRSNTSGAINTAVGMNSLFSNTTGGYNTAVGYNSLLNNTTGLYNTAIGQAAMDVSVSGHYNVAVGQDSLGGLSTGGLNTVIGRAAGWSLTTGSNNTLIGYNAQASTASTDSAVAIGLSVTGAGGYSTIGHGASDIRAAHGVATWAAVSDERYKQNITDSTVGLDFVNALRPRTWTYRTLGELPVTFNAYEEGSDEVFKNPHTNHGFIAQEVKAAIDADSGIKDGFKMWAERDDGAQEVAESALIPMLVTSIQQLSTQVEGLTARLAKLEGN